MANDVLRVINSEGRPFNVRLIEPGEPDRHRGRWQNQTKPTVEFYDAAHEGDPRFGSLGQFTGGRYYVADLLEHPKGVGLILLGDVPPWRLDGDAIDRVLNWLRERCLEIGDQP